MKVTGNAERERYISRNGNAFVTSQLQKKWKLPSNEVKVLIGDII